MLDQEKTSQSSDRTKLIGAFKTLFRNPDTSRTLTLWLQEQSVNIQK